MLALEGDYIDTSVIQSQLDAVEEPMKEKTFFGRIAAKAGFIWAILRYIGPGWLRRHSPARAKDLTVKVSLSPCVWPLAAQTIC